MILNRIRDRVTPVPSRRRARVFQPDLQVSADRLESRLVLSHAALASPVPAAIGPITQVPSQLITDLNFAINSVGLNNVGQLVATGNLTGQLLGHSFSLANQQLPLTLTPSTNILHLSLGPVNLNLLGLNVNLDNCNGGPVTVDITATSGNGQLLGNLLTGVSNLLNNGTALSTANNALLSGVLSGILNNLAGSTPTALGSSGMASHAQVPMGQTCPVLNLSIPNGVHVDLLGLHVDTSGICLNVTAQRGPGNLLGNLLCDVVHLLDNPGDPVGAILADLNKINGLLTTLLG